MPSSTRTELVINVADAESQLSERIGKGLALLSPRFPENALELDAAKRNFYTWDEYNTALLKTIFSTPELSLEYSYFGIAVVGGRTSLREQIEEFIDDVKSSIRRLDSIVERLPLYAPRQNANPNPPVPVPVPIPLAPSEDGQSRKVFVVHGRNNEVKESVARFLQRLELEPIILHEQASAGRTIIEKFEAHADCCFAVILLTPDDVGALRSTTTSEPLCSRARQNVIFEWGYFVAKLSRKKVCALVAEGLEQPSDMDGIVWVSLDQSGAWKMSVARELKASGISIDMNNAI